MPSSIDSFAETLASCVTIDDFEEAARARLPPMAYDDYRCGADEDSPRPRGRTSPPPPRSDLAVLAETCAPRPLVVKDLVRGDDARAALGLGARAVFVGRPVLWGLGAAGEAGVARVLACGSGPPRAPAALIAAIVAAVATIRSSEVGYSTATPRRIFASVRYAKQATAGAPDLEETTMQTTSSTEGTTPARTTTWTIDGSHTNATFSVRHLMISNVRGEFQKVSGSVTYDPAKPEATLVKVEIDVSSISTREPKRDTHLRSADFFDVANHPTITFESTSLRRADKNLELVGELTIRGTTREVVLAIDGPTPEQTDPWGNVRIGATATTKIKRSDFNMTWNMVLEAGGVVLGDEISIALDVELIKQK